MYTLVNSQNHYVDLLNDPNLEIFLQLENNSHLYFCNLTPNVTYTITLKLNGFLSPNLFEYLNLPLDLDYSEIKFIISYKKTASGNFTSYDLKSWTLRSEPIFYLPSKENIYQKDRNYGNLIDFNESDFQIDFFIPSNKIYYTGSLLSVAGSLEFSLFDEDLLIEIKETKNHTNVLLVNLLEFTKYEYLHVLFIRIGKLYKLFLNGNLVRYEYGSNFLMYREGEVRSWHELVEIRICKDVEVVYDFYYRYPEEKSLLTDKTVLYLDFNTYERVIEDRSSCTNKVVNPSINYHYASTSDYAFISPDPTKPFTINTLSKFSNFEIDPTVDLTLLNRDKFTLEVVFKNVAGNKRGSILENPGKWRLGVYDNTVRWDIGNYVALYSYTLSDDWVYLVITKENDRYQLSLNGEIHDTNTVDYREYLPCRSVEGNLLVKKALNQDGGLCRLNNKLYPSRSWIYLNLVCITIDVCKNGLEIPILVKDRYEL